MNTGAGNGPPAVIGAKIHAIRAARMGGDWCSVDEMSNLIMYTKLDLEFADVMTHKWSLFTKFHNENHATIAIADKPQDSRAPEIEAPQEEADATKPAAQENDQEETEEKLKGMAKGKSKAKGKAKTSPSGKTRPNDGPPPSDDVDAQILARKKIELKELNAEAQKIKAVLKSALADSQTLLESFETDANYQWGNHGAVKGTLQKNRDELKTMMNTFDTRFQMNSFTELQNKHGVDFLIENISSFNRLDGKAKALSKEVKTLLNMHAKRED